MALALTTAQWWTVGWAAGAAVVLVAALLLFAIIALARRIARQAADITDALEGAQANTAPLFDVTRTNLELDRIRRGVAAAREAS